jgi:hypothetical protein
VRLIITHGGEVVADIPGYDGPVPRAGEYVVRPRGREPERGLGEDVMSVKVVSYGIIARPEDGKAKCFTGAAEPFVEVIV